MKYTFTVDGDEGDLYELERYVRSREAWRALSEIREIVRQFTKYADEPNYDDMIQAICEVIYDAERE